MLCVCMLRHREEKRAEAEEKESYAHRMSERWKKDLEPLGTDMHKPFLETAPWLIVAFRKVYEIDETGQKHNNYLCQQYATGEL